jgi:hypothetical protein
MSESAVGGLALLGVLLVGIGTAIAWPPLGLVVVGLALLVLALLGSRSAKAGKEGES